MKDFLDVISAKRALKLITSFRVTAKAESIPLDSACGRVLARDVVAAEAIPQFARSVVDGFAVKAKDTLGAREHSPVPLKHQGEVKVAEEPSIVLQEGGCIYVNTGSMIPEGADAVLMQEYARRALDIAEVTRTVRKGENIFFRGEDIAAGSRMLKKGKKLTFADVGVLAALGSFMVPVFQRPQCAVVSSGDEIVSVEESTGPGKVRDINRYTISALLASWGGQPHFAGLTRDTKDEVCSILRSSERFDMILVSGGSSKGERDLITEAIGDLGGKVLFHGVNVRPGKPTIFGELWGKPVFGLPGHPMSCLMATVRFVRPLLGLLAGADTIEDRTVKATLASNIPSSPGVEEYAVVTLRGSRNGQAAIPLFTRSSAISSLARSAGYVIVPESSEGLEKGLQVEVRLFD